MPASYSESVNGKCLQRILLLDGRVTCKKGDSFAGTASPTPVAFLKRCRLFIPYHRPGSQSEFLGSLAFTSFDSILCRRNCERETFLSFWIVLDRPRLRAVELQRIKKLLSGADPLESFRFEESPEISKPMGSLTIP